MDKSSTIHLRLLSKKGGSRNESLTTFKAVCSPETAHAKLFPIQSIKTPDEADEFIHVIQSLVDNKDVIVKVQEPGRMLTMELSIQTLLSSHPNVVRYVCDFECTFNQLLWRQPMYTPRTFCDNEGSPLHILVMEYINNSLDTFLESANYTNNALRSIVKQIGFALLDIHVHYGISHNDLNRGNILLHVGSPDILTYTFNDDVKRVDTEGYLVVLIDFQRSSLVDETDEREYRVIQAADEISLAYELMKKWTRNEEHKLKLYSIMMDVMNMTDLSQIMDRIDSFE